MKSTEFFLCIKEVNISPVALLLLKKKNILKDAVGKVWYYFQCVPMFPSSLSNLPITEPIYTDEWWTLEMTGVVLVRKRRFFDCFLDAFAAPFIGLF